MALSFTKETLRALQNAVSFHEAVPSTNACSIAYSSLPSSRGHALLEADILLVPRATRLFSMAGILALGYAECLAIPVLVCGFGMGENCAD